MTIKRLAELAQHTALNRWLDAYDQAQRMPENKHVQAKADRYYEEYKEIQRIAETEQ